MQSGFMRKTLAPDTASGGSAANSPSVSGFEFGVRDLIYQSRDGIDRLARLYQPAGIPPFPAVIQIHGGAWNNKDRTDGQNIAMDMVGEGILVLSLDFRNAPEAPYPASLADINFGIRWFKAHAHEFGGKPECIGVFGTSSGGHQAMLAAIRPGDPRYCAIPLAEAPDMDARLAFVISGWGVLYPHERYKLAKAQQNAAMIQNHHTYFGSDEAVQIEATPALAINRKEDVFLPPAFVFQGTDDEWMSVEQAEDFAATYRLGGGVVELMLLEGEHHTFVNEFPMSENSIKTMAAVVAFIKQHGR